MVVIRSLPKDHLPLTCGSLCSKRTRFCLHGAPDFNGMNVTSWLPPWGAGASWGLNDPMGATQSPGGVGLRQGVLRKELTWQVGGTAGRPACLRRVSRGTGGSWSPSNGQWAQKWDGSLEWHHIWEIPLMFTGGVTAEVVRSLSKVEETEVWAQARVSVSRAAVKNSKESQTGWLKITFLSSPCSGGYKSQIQVLAGPYSPEGSTGGSFLPASGVHQPSLCSLASSFSTVVSASDVTWSLSPCLSESFNFP